MRYEEIVEQLSGAKAVIPGKRVKFDFGKAGKIMLDGVAGKVSAEDGKADATLQVKLSDFVSMAEGRLDPLSAYMQQRLKIKGDLALAQQVQTLMQKMRH